VDEVVLCFDADAAGEKAAERSLPHLLAEGLLVRVMTLPQGEDPDSLIRTQGAEVFRERVAAAKDFFDHQIDRLTGTPDFATPRGKIAAARKLAELLAFIPDGIAREAVLNNAAMRLGASAQDLRVLIKRAPQRAVLDEENPEPERAEPITFDATKEWLAHLALRSPAARMWLQAQGCDRVLNDGQPDSVLLLKILDADFRADEPASMNAWLATLEPGEESALSSALSRDVPPEARVVAEDCWHELERRVFLRKRQAIEAQLRAPGLAIEDMARLHSQVLDIQRQLAALPPPRAPKPTG
jgi:DNA primase